jgi:CheY-like chemotaxis protein
MDIEMPGIDGKGACRIIRESLCSNVPIIMCTGAIMCTDAADVEHVAKAIDAEATDYIKKPLDKLQLKAKAWSVISSG